MSIKEDINLNLLVIIIVAVGMFVLASVFYQKSIRDMQKEYDQKVMHLKDIEDRLIDEENRLNELLKSKDLIEKDKEHLEKSYLEIQKENNKLKNSLTTSFASFQKTLCKTTGNVQCLD